MNRLKNLARLNLYLRRLHLHGAACTVSFVTAQADATSRLASASGDNILIARPEYRSYGDSDSFSETYDTAVFVLAKDLGNARTDEKENEQYDRLAGLADMILNRIAEDTDRGCALLSGFSMTDVQVTPEVSLFGGWCGYSISISFSA